jgi:hypothetical protein
VRELAAVGSGHAGPGRCPAAAAFATQSNVDGVVAGPSRRTTMARSVAVREDTGVEAVEQLHAKRYQYIDTTHYFCGRTSCYPVIDGARVNADIYGHLNVTYARSLGPYLLRAIRRLEASW